ncbi:MAG TPA: YciK family oxidoreductase [Thiolapillus brandeum]|uniref:YciK family oxidoreductase n=1 Tax=Thiolapillus brandeum TaxID=1076588 RepID=A0A7C5IZ65_9GAMM|nr:YciK family oxidoreductase [Thiolapillus brandeum]
MQDYQPAPDLLKERVILVTGAADGIGRAAAIAFARHGATVVLLDKDLPGMEQAYDEIEAQGDPTPAIYPMHLEGATPHEFDELALKLEETFGRLDGILHNAASLPYLSRIKDYDAEDWHKVMQVNLNAPFMLTQALLPLLQESGDASLVFTSDTVGRRAKAFWGAYAVSKFGLEGLMQVLAEELENSPIRVNSVDPGPTRTALRKRIFPGENPETVKPPEALMPLYLWLMGPDSKGTHGQALSYPSEE